MYKKMDRPTTVTLGEGSEWWGGAPWGNDTVIHSEKGAMWTWGNYRWQDPRGSENVGSKLPWTQWKSDRIYQPTDSLNIMNHNGFFQWRGPLAARGVTVSEPLVIPTGEAWAASAYDRMKPTKPEFQGLNALYELRDLPRMLELNIKDRGLSSIGDYHLALEFGWRPLMNDIVNLVKTQVFLEKRVDQLLRDNGKPVRRRIQMLNDSDTQLLQDNLDDYSAFHRTFVSQTYYSVPKLTIRKQVTDRVWASARFRYWLPADPGGVVYKKRLIAALYGFYAAPKFVYDALPWSWMVDWFSNTGDIISNMSADVADRLAADYFYVMREQETRYVSTATGTFRGFNHESVSASATTNDRLITRSRIVGNPFGWALSEGDLSLTQLGIMGALGISRL